MKPITLALLALCPVLAACAQVERRSVFAPDFAAALARGPRPAADAVGTGPRPVPGEPEPAPARNADGALELSLEQATLLALENNRELAVRRVGPVIAGTFDKIERGVFDPELFAEMRFQEEQTSEVSQSTRDQFTVKGTENETVAGVRQRLPSGTTVELSVGSERTSSDRAPEQQTARLGLTVTQSLLRGYGSAVNLAHVRQAELDEEASLHELRGFTEALVADVRIAYWRYVLAEREIAIFEESLAVAQRQLDEVRQRIDVGVLPRSEAPSAHVEVARREQALIEARALLEERRLRLARLMDAEGTGALHTRFAATSELATATAPIEDLVERIELALTSRPDLREARLRLEQERLETIVTRNGVLPRLDLFAALDRTGFDDTLDGSFRDVDGKNGSATVGLSFTYYLGNRTARWTDVAARAARRRAVLAIDNLEQQIRFEVRTAANEVERARQQIAASLRTRELQAQLLAAEQERFDAGASTGLLVAQAQRDLLAVQIVEVESVVAYRIALLRLALAEGSLLGRSGIAIAP